MRIKPRVGTISYVTPLYLGRLQGIFYYTGKNSVSTITRNWYFMVCHIQDIHVITFPTHIFCFYTKSRRVETSPEIIVTNGRIPLTNGLLFFNLLRHADLF